MEILKTEQYINEKLNIKPVRKDRLDNRFGELYLNEYRKNFIKRHELVFNKQTMRYDCHGNVYINDIGLDSFPIKFGVINGNFNCSYNNLKSLEGAPLKVMGFFDCSNNELTSLCFAPQEIDDSFICSKNMLKTLEGAPKEIPYVFDCSQNKLKTLNGAPKEVGGNFNCSHNNLTTLEGAPKYVGGDFDCSDNMLHSIDCVIKGVFHFVCKNNPNLTMPKEKPNWIQGILTCDKQ